MAQVVKNRPTVWETWIRSLCWKDPLEKGMATHSSVLIWRIPWTEEPGGLQSMGSQRVRHKWMTNSSLSHPVCHVIHVLPLPGLDYCHHISPTWALDLPSEPVTGTYFIFLRHFSYSQKFLAAPVAHQVPSTFLSPQWHPCHLSAVSHCSLLQTLPLGWREVLEVSWTHTHTHLFLPSSGCFLVLNVFSMTFVSTPS